MSSRYLLDTNIVSKIPDEPELLSRANADDTLHLCATVLGELYFAAYNSGRVERNLRRIEDLFLRFGAFFPNLETARYFGTIKRALRLKGRPIPENDMWIAATVIQHDLILVTRDRHFADVDGLWVEQW